MPPSRTCRTRCRSIDSWGWESAPESAFYYEHLESVSVEKRLDYELIKFHSLQTAFADQGKKSRLRSPRRMHHTDPLVQAVLDDLSRDAILNPNDLVFKVALPNGRYQVSLILGDLQLLDFASDNFSIQMDADLRDVRAE